MRSWQPEAPWLGYKEGPHHTRSLSSAELQTLFKVGRQIFDIHFRGRQKGSVRRFDTPGDFEQAVLSAIQALRASGAERVSKAAIGRHIGRSYNPSHWDDDHTLKDPGGQIRRWEREFGVDVSALISRH
jgi:hypothetical protein